MKLKIIMKVTAILVLFSSLLVSGCASKKQSMPETRSEAKTTPATTPRSQQVQAQTNIYQQLTKRLQPEIKSYKVEIKQFDDRVRITIPNDVLFPGGGWTIDRKGNEILDKIIPVLKDLKNQAIEVYGYTDNAPVGSSMRSKFSTNRELSLARAVDIVSYLQKKGIDRDILSATGYGAEQPVATNDTTLGRVKNRRMEIAIMALDG
jgi:chemotaxis protein MotB